ncbi:hypothetical protein BDW62DRAFT_177605 [Aspergillus aurantiobrunneus]
MSTIRANMSVPRVRIANVPTEAPQPVRCVRFDTVESIQKMEEATVRSKTPQQNSDLDTILPTEPEDQGKKRVVRCLRFSDRVTILPTPVYSDSESDDGNYTSNDNDDDTDNDDFYDFRTMMNTYKNFIRDKIPQTGEQEIADADITFGSMLHTFEDYNRRNGFEIKRSESIEDFVFAAAHTKRRKRRLRTFYKKMTREIKALVRGE